MDLSDILPLLVVHLYALGTAAIVVGFLGRRNWLRRVSFWILLFGFAVHTGLLVQEIVRSGPAAMDRPVFIQFLAWCLAPAGFFAVLKWRSYAILLIISPILLAVFVMSRLLGSTSMVIPPAVAGMLSGAHIVSLFISFGMLTLAFGAALLFLIQERGIKTKQAPSEFQKELPALSVLDKVNALAVNVGFPLFTVGILLGFVAGRLVWGRTLADSKEWVSLIIWVLFAWLFHQRLVGGWRGRKPAVLAIWVFGVCVFSLTVVNFFLPTHHSYFNIPQSCIFNGSQNNVLPGPQSRLFSTPQSCILTGSRNSLSTTC